MKGWLDQRINQNVTFGLDILSGCEKNLFNVPRLRTVGQVCLLSLKDSGLKFKIGHAGSMSHSRDSAFGFQTGKQSWGVVDPDILLLQKRRLI